MADHVAVLRDGQIIADGTPEDVLGDVHTDEDLESHFDTHLSIRETDRGRLHALLRERNPWLWFLVAVLLVLGIGTIIAMLTSGLLDMGTGGGQGAGNQTMLPIYDLITSNIR